MAQKSAKTAQPKTDAPKPSRADIQLEAGPAFVTDIDDLPKPQRSQRVHEWLEQMPRGAIFTSKTLARAGIYKTAAAAASTIMRLHHAGLIRRVARDGKEVKGAYERAD